MTRTISAMIGKGSVSHNSRKFNAKNTDSERTHLNINYCNDDIKKVYHELFDDALQRYNEKQTRQDRKIENYYEKIRNGKQEKPFYEIILQIGNKDDTGADTPTGQIAKEVLDEYFKSFQERNPNLHVFSAHLHMDEATPHLHIDFVPFITGSKRGLDTRVSLKQALAAQGFKGGYKSQTEWNQWVNSEKTALCKVMERYDIEPEILGKHEEHLSVLDYKTKVRSQELKALNSQVDSLKEKISGMEEHAEALKKGLPELEKLKDKIAAEDFQLPEAQTFMSAKTYKSKVSELFDKLKAMVMEFASKYYDILGECKMLRAENSTLYRENRTLQYRNNDLEKQNNKLMSENNRLRKDAGITAKLRKGLGEESLMNILSQIKKVKKRDLDH